MVQYNITMAKSAPSVENACKMSQEAVGQTDERNYIMAKYKALTSADKNNKKTWTKRKTVAAIILGVAVLAFVISMIIAAIYGFGRVRPIKSTEEEARVVGSIAGYEVKYEELRYITLLHKQSLDKSLGKYSELSEDGKAEYREALEASVLHDIENNYVVMSLCDKYGIDTDSREVRGEVSDAVEEFVDGELGGKKEYVAWLEKNGLTDSFLRLVYKVDVLEGKLLEYMSENRIGIEYDNVANADFTDYVMESGDFIQTTHSYYPKAWEYKGGVSAVDKAAAAAKTVAAIGDSADRYQAMRSAIGSAPFVTGISMTGDGVYFTYGQMGEFYESVAFSLEEYEVSGAVESEDGYYVIMRLPLEREYVARHASELLLQYRYAALYKACDAEREQISFTANDYYNSIELVEIN